MLASDGGCSPAAGFAVNVRRFVTHGLDIAWGRAGATVFLRKMPPSHSRPPYTPKNDKETDVGDGPSRIKSLVDDARKT